MFAENVGTVEDSDTVRVTGGVDTFTYAESAVSHGSVNEGMYERYDGEQFLDGDTSEVLSGP